MPVKQSSFKTPQTLVNLSGELWPINKASHKESCIVNLLGVGILRMCLKIELKIRNSLEWVTKWPIVLLVGHC